MMHSYDKWRDRVRERGHAEVLLRRIGAPGHGECGKLHAVQCKATIHHQPRAGDNNYHEYEAFNVALAAIVRREFQTLAAEAIRLMEAQEREALIACKADVDAMQEAIQKATQS